MNEIVAKGSNEKFCSECGVLINAKAEICPKCGVRQSYASGFVSNGKSKVAAALLALFLGGIGAHKFYLGRIGMGILYLLFCWTFIPAIVSFIEFIVLLAMSEETFDRKYGRF